MCNETPWTVFYASTQTDRQPVKWYENNKIF